MRLVMWEDNTGYLRASLIRDSDPDEDAPGGVPREPPELTDFDCEEIRREVHNALVKARLFTWEDVMKEQNKLLSTIDRAIRRRLVEHFRLKEQEARQDGR